MNNVLKTRIVPSVGLLSEPSSKIQRYRLTSYHELSPIFLVEPRLNSCDLLLLFKSMKEFSSRFTHLYPAPRTCISRE